MESDEGRRGAPDAAAAREALEGLHDDDVALSARIVTPWWYHPVLGLIVAALVGAQALPTLASIPVMVLTIAAMLVLASVYRRRYGIWVSSPIGPRSRRMLQRLLALLIAAMLGGVAVKLAQLPAGWVLLPMVVAVVGVTVIGRRYDEALRRDLASPEDGR